MFYTYILYSVQADKYYIGQTENVEQRVIMHNLRKNLGANDWELKYKEEFQTRAEAVRRESEIKSKKRRAYLENLIATAG